MNEMLIEYIRKQLLNGQSDIDLRPDDDLLGSGLVDSIGMMQLISYIEKQYSFMVPPEDMTIENFMTVEAIGHYLERRK